MKKIIASILISLIGIPYVSAQNLVSPEYNYARIQLMQTPYKKYISQLETTIPQLSEEKLQEIYNRVSLLENSNNDIQILIHFIEELLLDSMNQGVQETILDPIYPPLSEIDKNMIQTEIADLQNILEDELLELMSIIMLGFEKMQSYEQKGDISANFSMNIPEFMEYKLGIILEDYISKNVGFDSNFESNFDIKIESNNAYESINGDVSGKIDVISKGGDVYFKADDISVNASELLEEEIKPYLEKLHSLGKENTYLHINDESSEYISQALSNLSMEEMERKIKEISEKNLLEAYAIDGNGYLLQPSQEMCSLIKEALSIFDPFSGKKCSDAQYADMLHDFRESNIILKLTPGMNKTLELIINNRDVNGNVSVAYSSYGIISIVGNIFEPNKSDVNNISFEYIPQDAINIEVKLDNEVEFNSLVQLKNNGSIHSAIANYTYSDGPENIAFNASYAASQLDMSLIGILENTNIDCSLSGIVQETNGYVSGNCDIRGEDYYGEPENYFADYSGNYDLRNGKNNMDISFDMTGPENMLFNMNIKNTGTLKYTNITDIITPKNTKSYLEFLNEISPFNNSYYDDSYYDDSYYDYYDDDYYNYTIEETTFPDYEQTCYIYNNGEKICDKYYDDYSEYCYDYSATTGENYCDISTDDYYYDGYSDIYYYDEYEIDGKTGIKTQY